MIELTEHQQKTVHGRNSRPSWLILGRGRNTS